ncbi:MAG: hypothetical protein WBF11_00110, partial [Methyloceanibacter sp.]
AQSLGLARGGAVAWLGHVHSSFLLVMAGPVPAVTLVIPALSSYRRQPVSSRAQRKTNTGPRLSPG